MAAATARDSSTGGADGRYDALERRGEEHEPGAAQLERLDQPLHQH
jgi:hypothetical protein